MRGAVRPGAMRPPPCRPGGRAEMQVSRGRLIYYPRARALRRDLSDLRVTAEGRHGALTVRQLENGTILVERDGAREAPALPALRTIARELGVDVLNGSGNPKNTRTLGADILTVLASTDLTR